MAYYFMMGAVPLPITPSSLDIKTPSLNTTVTLINEGEINIPKDQGLREISFEFLLPTVQKYPFANWQLGDNTATLLIPLLNVWKRSRVPFPFIVTRMSPTGKFLYFTSILCVIEDFDYKEDAEEYGLDTMCSITLKEYKPFGTKRIKLQNVSSDKPGIKQATVEKTRDTVGKSEPKKISTKKNETIISGARKTGDNLGVTLDSNYIKIPESCRIDPILGQDEYMSELNLSLDAGESNYFGDLLETNAESIKYSTTPGKGIDYSAFNQGRVGLPSSLAEAVLTAPSKTTYARPTVPSNVGTGSLQLSEGSREYLSGFYEFIVKGIL